ncbi:MAG TPA: patatin-like phospholipase family protein [Burkholderiales bacterium]|nr:patatin-like phospholipase family protein [Burkholderiales bacterium]
MLKAHAARRRGRPSQPRVGLALAGGGPLGGIYEIGALLAFADAFEGVDLNDLYVYVGVSSGSLIAAGLANGLSAAELYRIYIESASSEHPISADVFLRPAFGEYYRRAVGLPMLLLDSLWNTLQHPLERGLWAALRDVGPAIPAGVFDSAPMGRFLQRLFTTGGRTNDFRQLLHRLFVIATDLDTGESVEFGSKGYEHVPISKAVQASTALPGLFPPTRIDGRDFVDGALKKTLHASVALRQGATLVLCINPLVPFDASLARKHGKPKHDKLIEGGLPVVLAQTFRALIHSRMEVGMAQYDSLYPDADVLLFEPDPDDAEMFFTNVFSYANRRLVCNHAYQRTLREIARRRDALAPILARHDIGLRLEVLDQDKPHVKYSPSLMPMTNAAVKTQLDASLDRLDGWLKRRSPAASVSKGRRRTAERSR